MKGKIISGTDKLEVMELTNEFVSTLKKGQFYNTSMNPLVTGVRKVTTKVKGDNGEEISTEHMSNEYEFTTITFYYEESELDKTPKEDGLRF